MGQEPIALRYIGELHGGDAGSCSSCIDFGLDEGCHKGEGPVAPGIAGQDAPAHAVPLVVAGEGKPDGGVGCGDVGREVWQGARALQGGGVAR